MTGRGWLVTITAAMTLAAATFAAAAARADDAAPPPEAFLLYEAAINGDTATVASTLADHPQFATLRFQHGATALHAAALVDQPRSVELLIKYGAQVDARAGQQTKTPLFLAVMKGHARVARVLLDHHADPNAPGTIEGSDRAVDLRPLHLAAIQNRLDLAELLIRHGAQVSIKSAAGETPADRARIALNQGVLLLLQGYDKLGLTRGRSVATLLCAIQAGDSLAIPKQLSKERWLATVGLEGGWTPLHYSGFAGGRAACDALLARGADIRALDLEGKSPAIRAFDGGHRELYQYLHELELQAAAKPATKSKSKYR